MIKFLVPLILISQSCYALDLNGVIKSYEVTEDVPQLETSVSFIENVAVRVGSQRSQSSDDTDGDLQVRFSLNGYNEQEQKEKLYKNQQKRMQANREAALNEELALVYKLYLKLHFGIHQKNKMQKLLQIAEDKVRVIKAYMKKDKAFISDYIAIEQKIIEVKNKIISKNSELGKILDLLNRLLGKTYQLKDINLSESLVDINKIAKIVKTSDFQRSVLDLEVEKSNLEYKIEVGENNKIFDFIQLEVDQNNLNSANNEETRVGFQLAVNLPFFRDRSKVNEKFIDKLRAEYEHRYQKKAFIEEFDEIKLNILSFAESLKQIKKSSYLKRAEKYLRIYSRSKGVDPLKLLELNNTLINGQIQKLQLESDLYFSYISFLKIKGSLAKYSQENILAKNFKGEV